MVCTDKKLLFSALVDGELDAAQRLQAESHLHDCSGCQRYREQLERTVKLVRGLDAVPAPSFSVTRARRSASSAERRAARWESIRGRTLPPPQSALRSVLYAAVALLLVVIAVQATNRSSQPGLTEVGAPPQEQIAVLEPVDEPSGDEDRPEWLKREIARRVLESQAAGAPETDSENPAPLAGGDPQIAAEQGSGSPTPDSGPLQPVEIAGITASEDSLSTGSTSAGADRMPPRTNVITSREIDDPSAVASFQAEAIESETIDAEGRQPEARDPDSRTPELPAIVMVTPQIGTPSPPAANPAAPTGSGGPRARPARVEGRPTEPIPLPEPVDAGSLQLVALMGETEPHDLTFVESHASPAAAASAVAGRDEGAPSLHAEGRDAGAPVEETLPPEPDPRTGIAPPRLLERSGPTLGTRLSDPAEREMLERMAMALTLTADGTVSDATVLKGSGQAWLDEEILESARLWSFHPAEQDGVATEAVIEVLIEFELD